jgi:hypothetical protein
MFLANCYFVHNFVCRSFYATILLLTIKHFEKFQDRYYELTKACTVYVLIFKLGFLARFLVKSGGFVFHLPLPTLYG